MGIGVVLKTVLRATLNMRVYAGGNTTLGDALWKQIVILTEWGM